MPKKQPPEIALAQAGFPSAHDILMNAPIGIFTSTPEGKFLSINPAMADMYGYGSTQEMIGAVTDIAAQIYAEPADRHRFFEFFDGVDSIKDFEALHRRKDGSTFWTSETVHLVRDEKGNLTHLYGFITNISARKNTEQAEKKSEEHFRLMFTNAPMPYQSLDEQGNFLDVNKAFLNVLGYSREELIGKNFGDILHPAWRDHFQENFPRFKAVGEILGVEFEMVKKDGSTILVYFNGKIQCDDQDRFLRTHCIFQDITERKQAEQALRESEERFTLAMEATRDGLWDWNVTTGEVYFSPGYALMLGYDSTAVPPHVQTWLDLIHPEDKEKAYRASLDCINNLMNSFAIEFRMQAKDGNWLWILGRGTVAKRDDSGKALRLVGTHTDISTLKLAEDALRQKSQLLDSITNTMTDLVSVADMDCNFKFISPSHSILGYELDSLVGRNVKDFVYPEDYQRVENALIEFVTNKDEGKKIDYRYLRRDGECLWFETIGKFIFDEQGNEKEVLFTSRDITERKRAEEALLESEEMQRKILQTVPDLIIRTDLDGTITFVNEMAFPALESHPEEGIYGKNVFSFIAPHDLSRAVENARQRLEKNIGPQEYQLQFDGTVIDAEVNGAVISDMNSKPLGMVYIIRDITQRKMTENELLREKTFIEAIFNSVPGMLYLYDAKERLVRWNRNHETMTGFTFEELANKHILDWFRGDGESIQAILNGVRSTIEKDIGEAEANLQKKDGSTIPMYFTGIRLIINGEPYLTGIGIDITEQRRAAEEKEKLQAQLNQAHKMESVGILAGGVAHDFNNLLQVMRGNIELLLQGHFKDHLDAMRLQNVTRSIDRAAQLVQQLLFFSRKAESKKVNVDLNQEVQNVVGILERTIPKMIALELHLDPSIWQLFADPVQIEQIQLNLVGNAVEAMPDGGKLVIETSNVVLDEDFVKHHPDSSAGPHVVLTVTDTGCGIDSETIEHIFDPFFTTKEVGKGTGLGLASVYGIVKAHGGYIQCYSEPKTGTTFRVYLPAVELGDVTQVERMPEPSLQGGNETILVVDDEPEIRELTRDALEMLGYSVKVAFNGEQALNIYREHGKSIHLVLLDLNMPGMGGYKCLKELLRLDREVKVVVASGYKANARGKDMLASGAKGFLGKPFMLKELAAMVRRALDEKTNEILPE
ncbi:hybrid sensor histidine kinase/response regulator [Desulfonatronum thioautotrophicum]|uniref:hybrid sensor histidine kinase/response regulator n=1 Tax=Desulfonatronum thioautotrophicum TaxID=617001 RepID=UPI0005EB5024|nr:PAS domain S-box protein [Desulfonatronum thioautotrophicum]